MTGRLELVAVPLRALRRSVFWWAAGLAGLVAGTVAFWPVFRGSTAITDALDQLPSGILGALGLANFGTPAGYLRGNLYELFLPLLLAAAAVVFVNGQTAGEEASGRLEMLLAQPVDRRNVFLGRAVAALIGLIALTLMLAVVQFSIDAVVDLRINSGYLLSTILLCSLLAALHGSVAFAVACLRARPSRVLGIGIGVALAGYLVAALFPLSGVLNPWRHISPWDWAFGGDPLEQAAEAWRYLALLIPTVLLTAGGVVAVARRDIASG